MTAHRTQVAVWLVALALALVAGACAKLMPRDASGLDPHIGDPPVRRLAWSGGSLVAELGWDGYADPRWPMQGYATRYVTVDLQDGDVRPLGDGPDRVVRAAYPGHPAGCHIACDRGGACHVATPHGVLAMPGRCPADRSMTVACGGGRVVAACGQHLYVHREAWRQVVLFGSCIAPGPFADDLVVGTGNNGVEVWDLFPGARIGHVRLRRRAAERVREPESVVDFI